MAKKYKYGDYEVAIEAPEKGTDGLQVEMVPIPMRPGPQWDAFCRHFDIDGMDSDRRGWWSRLSTYIRSSTHVVLMDGEPVDLHIDPRIEQAPSWEHFHPKYQEALQAVHQRLGIAAKQAGKGMTSKDWCELLIAESNAMRAVDSKEEGSPAPPSEPSR